MSLGFTLAWNVWVDPISAINKIAELMGLEVQAGVVLADGFHCEVVSETRLGNQVNEKNWGLESVALAEFTIASRLDGNARDRYQTLIYACSVPFLAWLDADGVLLFNDETLYMQRKMGEVTIYDADEWRRLNSLLGDTSALRLVSGPPPSR